MNPTSQDRLAKELRIEGIDSIDAENEFLVNYMEDIHMEAADIKSGKEPLNATDLHRPLTELDDVEESMCWQ